MLGGTTAVERGEITLIGAGPKTAYVLAEPLLKDLSTRIFYVGTDHGTASALKLAININIALITLALVGLQRLKTRKGLVTGLKRLSEINSTSDVRRERNHEYYKK